MGEKKGPGARTQCRVIVHYQGKRAILCGIYLDKNGSCYIHGKQR